MVSHPETGSDSPIGSDRDRGRDRFCVENHKIHWIVELIYFYQHILHYPFWYFH